MADKYRRLLSTYRLRTESNKHRTPARSLSPEQTEVLRNFVQRLNQNAKHTSDAMVERRGSTRHPCAHSVLITPCATPETPRMADTSMVVVKDVSSGGISFVQPGPFGDPYFLVTFRVRGVAPICLLARVQRMEPARLGLYIIGGEFQERVSLGDEHDRDGQPSERAAGT